MFRYLGDTLRRLRGDDSPEISPPAPERPFAVVGDVHGCSDLLLELLAEIEDQAPDLPIVLTGDLIDRGPQSYAVLCAVHAEATAEEPRLHCILGNHEQLLLAFLEDPARNGVAWLSHGGLQTIESLGLRHVPTSGGAEAMHRLAGHVADAIGPAIIDWLGGLPLWWQNGNVVVVHAGADPRLPLEDQPQRDLIWGNRLWPREPRRDGLWIIHGHTIRPACEIVNDTICIDTGAYASGVLSGAIIGLEDGVRFLSAYSRK